MGGLAIAGLVLQGAGMLSGFKSQKRLKKRAGRLAATQVARLGEAAREDVRLSVREERAMRGTQRAAFAGGNIDVGVGSARLVEAETLDEFARSRKFAGLSFSAEMRAARLGGQVSGPNYASGLGSLAQSMAAVYTTQFQKPSTLAPTAALAKPGTP